MTQSFLRRTLAAATACAALVLLSACGSSSTESAFTPERVVSFGDAFSDLGQTGGKYTVNDGNVSHWLDQVSQRFERPIAATAAGGLGYGTASARVTRKPDPAGSDTVPTVTEQIDRFLATQTVNGNDLVILGGGIADIVAEEKALLAGSQTEAQMMENLGQAGRELAAQARRLVAAGVRHVVVVGALNVGFTPWAGEEGPRTRRLTDASLTFNEQFLVAAVDLGANVLYVDALYYFNLLSTEPGDFDLSNAAVPVCTSVDPGPGIGIGDGQVNSSLCNTSTLLAGVDYNRYAYADALYPAPRAHRLFGDYAYDRIRNRW